ncbi:hypothetical protein [Mucilaginibacter ginsenosidivorax]|uniref:Uncharacterized protein n=1 Tax=Mucilaginibacter ginsenosidivorax TaxID=862126 RepID=A0A5B8W7R5_9SPHI|nr:hypothetical protein [Mucilaginibacter ginsenosidivorax]QEC79944.1 hypothetical protein FSB76_29775 [Mucilaginibacter ginsenosidivorax]
MPQFISKLQRNTYEKGEFSDEQPRNLDETIQLIKDFPWDLERPLTDIQLTGPSVTIQDAELNYLKLGLYFGGKFCVYYLDKDNQIIYIITTLLILSLRKSSLLISSIRH